MAQTKLDANQVIKSVFDESQQALRTTAGGGPSGGATEAEQQAQTALLTDIESNQDSQTAILTDIETNTENTADAVADVETELQAMNNKLASALVTEQHDFIEMTYVGLTTDIDTVTYKLGGAGGTTVATLTMGYDGNNRLATITKS